MRADKLFFVLGGVSAASAVLLGAFAAHSLKGQLAAEALAAFDTAVRYQFLHAIGLFITGFSWGWGAVQRLVQWAGALMVVGTFLFCGSLYLLALAGAYWAGPITPIGGVAFTVSWILLALAALRR